LIRIKDILEAIARIERYTNEMNIIEFERDEKTVDAVIRNFTVIGEAAARVPKEERDHYSAIPWDKIIGMRNFLVHECVETTAASVITLKIFETASRTLNRSSRCRFIHSHVFPAIRLEVKISFHDSLPAFTCTIFIGKIMRPTLNLCPEPAHWRFAYGHQVGQDDFLYAMGHIPHTGQRLRMDFMRDVILQ